MAVNGLTDHFIRVGQELLVPVEAPTPGTSPEALESPSAGGTPLPGRTTYVVQAGDSLSEIARRFGVSLEAIMEANDITDPDSIREGQELVVPGGASSTETPGIGGPPTPTVSSQFVYRAPILLGPPDGWEFREEDAELPILLNWLSVGLLGEDEWYSVAVRYVATEEGEAHEIVELTKATSFRVPLVLRPPLDAEVHLFEWDVGVTRLIETEDEDTPDAVRIGRDSESHSFYWY